LTERLQYYSAAIGGYAYEYRHGLFWCLSCYLSYARLRIWNQL